MNRFLLLAGCTLLLCGIVYTVIAPASAAVQSNYPETPEGWVKLYEDEAQKCAKEAYELHSEMEKTRGQVAESGGAPMLVMAYMSVRRDYVEACGDYHHYLRQAAYARSRLATPTPTPSPTPTPLLPAASPEVRTPRPLPSPPGTGTIPLWPREENDLHVKFITDQERKRRELKERADKLIKEANDLLNKAKTAKTKPPTPGYKTEFDSTDGLLLVNLTTPQGVLKVSLPDDMRAGDTVSGSIIPEPTGQTKEERARNRAGLNQYQLVIANSRPGANDFILKLFRRKLPTANTGTVTNSGLSEPCACPVGFSLSASGQVEGVAQPANVPGSAESATCVEGCPAFLAYGGALDNISGDATTTEAQYLKPLTEAQIDQLYDIQDTGQPPTEPRPNQFRLPTTGQNGSSVEIKGPFDGNLRTTDIRIGGQPVIKLAESPRICIFKSPEQNFGPTDITLKENNVETKGTYRNLGVRLSAPKTSLLKGETTTVTIEVSGLSGIKYDVPLHLEASGVINMAGSNYQYLSIRPQEVKPDGRYTTTRTITGQQAGGFGVTATVIDLAHRPIIIPLTENARVNGFRVKKEGDGFVIEVEGAQSPITGKPVDGEQKLEHQCPDLTKVPYINRLFLNKGIGKAKSECLILITPRIIIQEESP